MINKKKLIAYTFVAIMIISAFAGVASIIPATSGNTTITGVHNSPIAPSSVSASSGGTVNVSYGVPVSFPQTTHDSSSTNTATNTNTACSTSGYPAYPSYP